MAQAKLYKNGNSVVVALPKEYLEDMQLKAGDHVIIGRSYFTDSALPTIIIIAKHKTNGKPKSTS